MIAPLEDGTDRSIDARSIVTLITFFVVNALVIWPLRIPLPLLVSRWYTASLSRISSDKPLADEVDSSQTINECDANLRPSPTSDAVGATRITPTEPAEEVVDGRPVAPTLSAAAVGKIGDGREIPGSGSSASPRLTEKSAKQDGYSRPRPSAKITSDQTNSSSSSGSSHRVYFPLDLRTAPVIGVLLLLASTCIPGTVVRRGIVGSGGVRPYDIMTLFLSFAYISLSLDATGVLRYLAFLVASRSTSHGGGRALYNAFYLFFSIIGLAFGNDPLILSGTPFLAYFTDHASISPPTAYLFTHFQVVNLVSALLVSSNPTNLVLTSAFGISFLSYSAWLALPTVAAVLVLYPILRYGVFSRKGLIPSTIHPPKMNPRDALLDPLGAIFGATVFVIVIVALIALSAVDLLTGTEGVWTVTAPAAAIVLLRDLYGDWSRTSHQARPTDSASASPPQQVAIDDSTKEGHATPNTPTNRAKPFHSIAFFTDTFPTTSKVLAHLPLPLIPFAFSFFILVEGLQHTGWIRVFGGWWGAWERVGGVAGSVALMGILSVIGCNFFGTNIGATILLSRVLQQWGTTNVVTNRSLYGAVFALAVGSNFGAYSFVFSASLAGLLWRNILSQNGISVTLRQFIKWNSVPVIVTMIVGCLVVAGEVCVIYHS